jgi:hypothetical protein
MASISSKKNHGEKPVENVQIGTPDAGESKVYDHIDIRGKRRRALSKDDIETIAEMNYLENVIVVYKGQEKLLNTVPEIKEKILNSGIMNLTDAENEINEVINLVTTKKEMKMKPGNAEWIYCKKDCVKNLSAQIKKEIKSTAFMLRVLTNSVIDTTADDKGEGGSFPLKFIFELGDGNLSGVWENDYKYFKLKVLDPDSQKSRLIMGLGPSASGKTFWAKNVIKLMRKANSNFPRSFLSVDGGLVRELSYVYQDIIRALSKHPKINGLRNLVSSGWDPFHKSLFKAGHVKKSVQEYLKTQKTDNGLPVSLYVPETLGSPLTSGAKSIDKYVKITGDNNWIGLYIWQGITKREDQVWVKKFKAENPIFKDEHIGAMSTTDSGKGRELTEGKKYSPAAYNNSKNHGYKALRNAPGASIEIHNSGGEKTNGVFNKSVVIEYRNGIGDRKSLLNQEMLDEFNSIYLQKPFTYLLRQKGGRKTRRLRRKSRKRKTKRKGRKNKRRRTKHKRRKRSRKR